MSNVAQLLERSLHRDALMRSAGRAPTPVAEKQLIELIVEHNQYGDGQVREWLRSRSDSEDYWVIKGLLSCIWPLMSSGFGEDAVAIFANIVGIRNDDDARTRRRQIVASHSGLTYFASEIIKREDIPLSALRCWGIALITLQGLLLDDDREESLRRHLAAVESSENDVRESFDYHHYSFYSPHRRESRGWSVVATTVERIFSKACALSDSEDFGHLATHSVGTGWGLAVCQPLVALFDCLRRGPPVEWHKGAALWLLSTRDVERKYAAVSWRRLLRKELLPHLTNEERMVLIDAVRQHQPDDRCRLDELSDLAGFVALTADEEESIRIARAEGRLHNTSDSREIIRFESSGFPHEEDYERPRQWESWPNKDEQEVLRELILSDKRALERDNDASALVSRASSLRHLLAHTESRTPQWLTGFLRWATAFLIELKSSCRAQQGLSATQNLDSNVYFTALTEFAPWWKSLANSSFDALSRIPANERSDVSDLITWSSDDVTACACSYLDELLATLPGTPIDELRQEFVDRLVSLWTNWSTYTRFVAIANIRTYHWKSSGELSSLLEETITNSTHSHGIGLALEHLLRGAGSEVARVLQALFERLDQLTDPFETARIIGRVIGDAVIRYCGDNEETTAVAKIADFYLQLREEPLDEGPAKFTFVAAVCEGAREHLCGLSELTDQHAKIWLEMMQWALQSWFLNDAENRDGLPFSMGAAIWEMKWSSWQQAQLMQGMVALVLQTLREAELGGFYEIHYEFRKLYKPDNDRMPRVEYSHLPDATWLSFCIASATRVAEWRKQNRMTNDIAYVSSLTGENTSDLIKAVFEFATDRDNMRRELAPVIDVLADAGLHDVATKLRTWIRAR